MSKIIVHSYPDFHTALEALKTQAMDRTCTHVTIPNEKTKVVVRTENPATTKTTSSKIRLVSLFDLGW